MCRKRWKGKSAFAGQGCWERRGVIGLGAIGVMVANAAVALGMDVIGYDPYISIDAAWGLSRAVKKADTVKVIYEASDYITLHVPLNDETRKSINQDVISIMKDGVRILNFSRGELVDDDAVISACENGKIACYVTDFPNEKMIGKNPSFPFPI